MLSPRRFKSTHAALVRRFDQLQLAARKELVKSVREAAQALVFDTNVKIVGDFLFKLIQALVVVVERATHKHGAQRAAVARGNVFIEKQLAHRRVGTKDLLRAEHLCVAAPLWLHPGLGLGAVPPRFELRDHVLGDQNALSCGISRFKSAITLGDLTLELLELLGFGQPLLGRGCRHLLGFPRRLLVLGLGRHLSALLHWFGVPPF